MGRTLLSLVVTGLVVLAVVGLLRRQADGPRRAAPSDQEATGSWHPSATDTAGSGILVAPGSAADLPAGSRFAVSFSGWSAPSYGAEAPRRELDVRAARVLQSLGAEGLRYDTSLARVAETLAGLEADGAVPLTGALVDFVLWRKGVLVPTLRRYRFTTSARDDEGFLDHLRTVLAREPAPDGTRLVGVGRADGAVDNRFRTTFVIVTAEPLATLELIPREPRPGSTVEVAGRLVPRLHGPEVLYMDGDGDVRSLSVREGSRGKFSAQVTLPTTAQTAWIEVLATGPLGPEVVCLFPLSVGQEVNADFEGVVPPAEGAMGSPEELERIMAALVNADRELFGLAPLAFDPALAAIARGHAEDLRDHGYVAHGSPRTGDVSDRARAAGYAYVQLGENVARDASVHGAHAGLMRSLGHRKNVLSPHFTRLGVGVAVEEQLSGGRLVYVVQNFARPLVVRPSADVAAVVRERFDEARRAAGLAPLRLAPELSRLAAEALSRPLDPDAAVAAVGALLEKRRAPRGTIHIRAYAVAEPEQLAVPEVVLSPAVTAVGLAAQHPGKQAADPRYRIIVLLEER